MLGVGAEAGHDPPVLTEQDDAELDCLAEDENRVQAEHFRYFFFFPTIKNEFLHFLSS